MEQDRATGEGRNHRNDATSKRVLTGDGHVEITIPRNREARFEPVLIGKYQRDRPECGGSGSLAAVWAFGVPLGGGMVPIEGAIHHCSSNRQASNEPREATSASADWRSSADAAAIAPCSRWSRLKSARHSAGLSH